MNLTFKAFAGEGSNSCHTAPLYVQSKIGVLKISAYTNSFMCGLKLQSNLYASLVATCIIINK